MHIPQHRIFFSVLLGLFIATIVIWAQEPGQLVLIDTPVNQDLYAASRDVSIETTVNGDVVVAGQNVSVDGRVTGDVIVAARDIKISAAVGDDVRAAGQYIRVTAPVAGHIAAAGQTVTISKPVGEWAWLAGNTVEVLDTVGGKLTIHARNITVDSQITGDVELIGEKLNLGPKTVVLGNLTWRSDNEADIDPGARIDGQFTKAPLPDYADADVEDGGLFFTLRLIVAVAVLFLLFPNPMRSTTDRLVAHPVLLLILGFVVMVVAPVVAIILMVTGVGVWLGLALLGIYLVALLLGVLTGLFSLSDIVLRRFQPTPTVWQALAAIIGTIVAVGLLTYVPVVGTLMALAIGLFGFGALCHGCWVLVQRYRNKPLSST